MGIIDNSGYGQTSVGRGRTIARSLAFFSSCLILTAGLLSGCWGEHQIGTSKQAFKTIDALYTAVGLRDTKLVDQCDKELKALGERNELPAGAAETLDQIVTQTRSGEWEPAQERLSRFMEGQHR